MSSEPRIKKEDHTIRVFISSTFRDMYPEREELVKRIFPQLRKICETRGVTWGEVDLRWGITDEQKAEGLVLPVCLDEIERCRPYFIGILGERYGWIPEEIPESLIASQPWLREHLNESVTSLEIIYGVLQNPDMEKRAFFYFRNPSYLNSLSEEERTFYQESPTNEEIKHLGLDTAAQRAEKRKIKLQYLKDRIRQSGFPVRENYRDPIELGQLVFQDLKRVIDSVYPEDAVLNALDRERVAHESYVKSRFSTAKKGIYIGRESYFRTLDEHITGNNPPLIITGSSGSGKSALLANWMMDRFFSTSTIGLDSPIKTDKVPAIFYFVGATADSTNWVSMLQQLTQELIRSFDLKIDIPQSPDALRTTFAVALSMAAAKGKFVLIIDALNQLEDREGALDLVWLPYTIPANARIILSTLGGRSLQELESRNWEKLLIQPFTSIERESFISKYLGQFGKHLPEHLVTKIEMADQSANPLYLRSLLDELRIYGDHYTLANRIDHYLTAHTVNELYEKILERYEQDYERDVPGLVTNAMALLWSARKGLSEAELLDLLGSDNRPLPHVYWSPLYLAVEQGLINKSGLLSPYHDYLKKAIEHRYLNSNERKDEIHRKLADYFLSYPLGSRKIDELPWHLVLLKSWDSLVSILADNIFLPAMWAANEFDVKSYWGVLERESKETMEDAYSACISSPQQFDPSYVSCCSQLLDDTGHLCASYTINKYLIKFFQEQNDFQNFHKSLRNQAWILYKTGYLDKAMGAQKDLERSCRVHNDLYALQKSLGNQGLILFSQGKLEAAMAFHKEKEEICRKINSKESLHGSLGNQALILKAWGKLDEAMKLHKEEELICREIGDKDALQRSLGNQALIYKARGMFDDAMRLLEENEMVCREINNKEGLQAALGNQALILYERKDLKRAMELYKQQEDLCKSIGNKDALQGCLGNQALILFTWEELDGALALHKEEEKISRDLGNKDGLQASLANQANIMMEKGCIDEALRLYQESETLNREIGKKDSLAISLINQASIFKTKDPPKAFALAKEAYEIASSHGFTTLAKRILPIYWELLNR